MSVIDKPPPRRKEFDEITMGWGSDNLPNLGARVELALEWQRAHFPLSVAEIKVLHAMTKRFLDLGGDSRAIHI